MALFASSGSEFKKIAEGLHPAACIGALDIGTQHSDKFGTDSRQVVLMFELLDEPREYEGEHYNARVSKTLTLSMNPKSNLRKLVESWVGRMTDQQASAFDILSLAGKHCMVQTSNSISGAGKTISNIVAVVSVPKGTVLETASRSPLTYQIGDEIPEGVPEWIVNKITASPEYRAIEAENDWMRA